MSDEPIRRRIDRVTAEDFLDGLDQRTPAEIREMRDDCREEEARLSYARRLLHAKLDVARAELTRRDGGSDDTRSLVEALGEILVNDPPSGPVRSAANADLYNPDGDAGRRLGDGVLESIPLGTLPDLADDRLVEAVTTMSEEERTISAVRRQVLDHLDRLQQEMIARYRDGGASVDDIVPPSS
ncbi:hypothetical protein BH23ACT9_BH23ACT9_01960 [soil metagenome]